MYDVEQFLTEAGAERINEKAVISLERELQDTVNSIVHKASIYANYAGRRKLINISDIKLTRRVKTTRYHMKYSARRQRRHSRHVRVNGNITEAPKIMVVNNIPIVEQQEQVV